MNNDLKPLKRKPVRNSGSHSETNDLHPSKSHEDSYIDPNSDVNSPTNWYEHWIVSTIAVALFIKLFGFFAGGGGIAVYIISKARFGAVIGFILSISACIFISLIIHSFRK
jgi:hypothetical protein